MNKLNDLIKQALKNQYEIEQILNTIKESGNELTEEQEDRMNQITSIMKDEIMPEIERLEKTLK